MKNPFLFGQVIPPDASCYWPRRDLERAIEETADNHQRLVLVGDRRVGKTSAVEHTLRNHPRHLLVTVDLLGLNSVGDLLERIRLRLDDTLRREQLLTKHLPPAVLTAVEAIASLKIKLPIVSVEAHRSHVASINELMSLIDRVSEWRPLVIFLDEFQEIADQLPAEDSRHVLGVLRGAIQRQNSTAYIFAGSQKDSLLEIFTASTSPFFKTAHMLDVWPIPRGEMSQFLLTQFSAGDRMLDQQALDSIFLIAGDNPSDLQELAYHIWARSTPGRIDWTHVRDACSALMHAQGKAGERIFADATPNQRRALFALAVEPGDSEVYTDRFAQLGGFAKPQIALRAIEPFTGGRLAILEKHNGKVRYRERFMQLWFASRLLNNPSMFPAMPHSTDWLKTVALFVGAPTDIPAQIASRRRRAVQDALTRAQSERGGGAEGPEMPPLGLKF
jgi:hypothetical protein